MMIKKIFSKLLILILVVGLLGSIDLAKAAPLGTMTGTALTISTDDTSVAINMLTVTDSGGEITAASDLWIKISNTVNAEWDSADTLATIAITGTGQISSVSSGSVTVGYSQADGSTVCGGGIDCKVLKLDVTTNFANTDLVTIVDLSMIPGTVGSGAQALEWSVDGGTSYGTGNSNTNVTVVFGTATTTTVPGVSPVISATPADDSDTTTPTDVGSNVTFTATAVDVNADNYYLAVCKTDAVTAVDGAAPTCPGTAWSVSSSTVTGVQASTTYTALIGDAENNNWFSFVCDAISLGSSCYPANANGDLGRALGTVTFSGIPVDTNTITIDSVIYEFDDNATFTNTQVDISAASSAADVATALAAAEAGTSSHMADRSNVTYVYADAAGTGGNSIGMTIGTCPNCAVSGATLAGGDATGSSPFNVNHVPSYTFTSALDTGGGTIEPGDTVRVTVTSADSDTAGGQDTVKMVVCASGDTFNGTCSGTQLCTTSLAVPGSIFCDLPAGETSVPTAHGAYNFEVFMEDGHGMIGTGSSTQNYTVQDVVPVLVSYTTILNPAPAAGGSDTVTYSVALTDDNGDNDVEDLSMVLWDDSANAGALEDNCSADENDCYIENIAGNCSFTGQGAGTDEALGADCTFTVWFNANASIDWEVSVTATDQTVRTTNFADSNNNITIAALSGVDIVQTSIAYGTVSIGGTSSSNETSVGNVGNTTIDYFLSGDDMCTDYPTCSGSTIDKGYQRYHHTLPTFNWDDGGTFASPVETAAGPYTLDATGSGTISDTGCLDRDIDIRNDHTNSNNVGSGGTNEPIYWKIRIPSEQAAGSYTGANVFQSTSSSTCDDSGDGGPF